MQAVGCQMSLSVVVFGSWLSAVVCRVLVIDCRYRLSLPFSIVGAQLCTYYSADQKTVSLRLGLPRFLSYFLNLNVSAVKRQNV